MLARHRAVAARRVPRRRRAARRPGRYRWALVARRARPRRIATTSARSRCSPTRQAAIADAEQAAGGRSRGDRVPEGAAVDERVRDGAGAGGRGARRRSACRPTIEPLPGGEAIVAAPAAGRFTRRHAAVDRRSRARGPGARPPRAAADRRRPIARRSPPTSPKRRPRSRPRAPNRRAPNGCWPSAPCRRGGSRRRSAPSTVAEARLRAAEARLAQRDETLRTGGGAAAGNAFVLRAPIAGRVAEVMATLGASYDEGAPLFRSSAPIASSCRRTCRRPTRRCRADVTAIALEIPGPPGSARRSMPITCTTPASSTRRPGRCRVQIEVDNPAASC